MFRRTVAGPRGRDHIVDYNTPDDYPTFPEAIQDTLTERTKKVMRVLRVRPWLHERFRKKTHLHVLEPIARNIALRRTSPANRWILSSTTDMIFTPRPRDGFRAFLSGKASLGSIVRDLPRGFYQLPRFELPESLWESFDRLDPKATIADVFNWGNAAHLNEIVHNKPHVRFDAPGDFQLIERDEFFAMHGFHEEMILGWHVDSNLSKRAYLRYGRIDALTDHIFGYHCGHTRAMTTLHNLNRVQNDIPRFVDAVTESEIEEQADTWGCPGDEIEEFRLPQSPNRIFGQVLKRIIPASQIKPAEIHYIDETFDTIDCTSEHLLPYIADLFVSTPRTWDIAWFGGRLDTLSLFAAAHRELGFTGRLLAVGPTQNSGNAPIAGITIVDPANAIAQADAFVCDFANPDGNTTEGAPAEVVNGFLAIISAEHMRMAADLPPRRIVALNTTHGRYEQLIRSFMSATSAPLSTRLRQGYALPPRTEVQEWLPVLSPGGAGERFEELILAHRDRTGCVFYGPYARLITGRYRAQITFGSAVVSDDVDTFDGVLGLEASIDNLVLAYCSFSLAVIRSGAAVFEFELNEQNSQASLLSGTELKLRSFGHMDVAITGVTVTRIFGIETPVENGWFYDWLSVVSLGNAGKRIGNRIRVLESVDNVFHGPYWRLKAGRYRCAFTFSDVRYSDVDLMAPALLLEILDRGEVIASRTLDGQDLYRGGGWVDFIIPQGIATDRESRIEFRLGTLSPIAATIDTVTIDGREGSTLQSDNASSFDWTAALIAGEAGERVGTAISTRPERWGCVFYGPYWRLKPGRYRAVLHVNNDFSNWSDSNLPVLSLEIALKDHIISHRAVTPSDLMSGPNTLDFCIWNSTLDDGEAKIEARLRSLNGIDATIEALEIEWIGEIENDSEADPIWLACLPIMQLGTAAERVGNDIRTHSGVSDTVMYGPYWRLCPGRYALDLAFSGETGADLPNDQALFDFEVVDRNWVLTSKTLNQVDIAAGGAMLDFVVTDELASDPVAYIEFRLRSFSGTELTITDLTVQRVAA